MDTKKQVRHAFTKSKASALWRMAFVVSSSVAVENVKSLARSRTTNSVWSMEISLDAFFKASSLRRVAKLSGDR